MSEARDVKIRDEAGEDWEHILTWDKASDYVATVVIDGNPIFDVSIEAGRANVLILDESRFESCALIPREFICDKETVNE